MAPPEHIAQRIRAIVARTSTLGGHIDNEAARYGGIAVMSTIGAVWLLRPDGTVWEVDDDCGRPLTPLPAEWYHAAIACGALSPTAKTAVIWQVAPPFLLAF